MMRQGLHTQLDTAEHCWQEHKKYEIDGVIHIPQILQDLINKSNCEIERTIH